MHERPQPQTYVYPGQAGHPHPVQRRPLRHADDDAECHRLRHRRHGRVRLLGRQECLQACQAGAQVGLDICRAEGLSLIHI